MYQNKILPIFLKYTSANILSMVGLSAYILADTYFISRALGAYGLAALNLAIPIYSLIYGFGLMIGIGGATKFAILSGKNETEQANRVYTNTFVLMILASAAFIIAGLFFAETIARLFGADEVVLEMTYTYLRIIMFFAPLFLLITLMTSFIRNDGAPVAAMAATLISSLSNILYDYIFIIKMEMGMFGAAIATGVAAATGLVFVLIFLITRTSRFKLIKCKLSRKIISETFSLGLPTFVSEMSVGVVIISFNLIILGIMGNIGIASYAVVANISIIIITIYNGLSQGMQPLISRYHGQGESANVKTVMRYGFLLMAAISVMFYLFVFFNADFIAGVFNRYDDPVLNEIAAHGMRIFFISSIFAGANIIISTFFASTATPRPAHVFSLLRGVLLILPMALILSSLFGMTGVWLALPITEATVLLLALGLFVCRRKTARE